LFSSAFVSDGVCGLSAVRMTLTIVGNAAKAILCNEIKGKSAADREGNRNKKRQSDRDRKRQGQLRCTVSC